jgi:hypothetical protein
MKIKQKGLDMMQENKICEANTAGRLLEDRNQMYWKRDKNRKDE